MVDIGKAKIKPVAITASIGVRSQLTVGVAKITLKLKNRNLIVMEGLENIVGLKCVDLRVGYADTLIRGFGRLVEHNHPKMKGKYHGEWQLSNRFSRWRVVLNNRVVAGDYDTEWSVKERFDLLISRTLFSVNAGQLSTDLLLHFDDGHQIQLICTDHRDEAWWLSGPKNKYETRKDGHISVA